MIPRIPGQARRPGGSPVRIAAAAPGAGRGVERARAWERALNFFEGSVGLESLITVYVGFRGSVDLYDLGFRVSGFCRPIQFRV